MLQNFSPRISFRHFLLLVSTLRSVLNFGLILYRVEIGVRVIFFLSGYPVVPESLIDKTFLC